MRLQQEQIFSFKRGSFHTPNNRSHDTRGLLIERILFFFSVLSTLFSLIYSEISACSCFFSHSLLAASPLHTSISFLKKWENWVFHTGCIISPFCRLLLRKYCNRANPHFSAFFRDNIKTFQSLCARMSLQ